MIKCVKCGFELNEGTKFCTECGSPQEPAQVDVAASVEFNCAKCGAVLEPDSKFCTTCGAPALVAEISGEVASAQPVASSVTSPAAPGPLYPTSTPQGYRCPSCSAFLQPGSTFCATCGAQFAQGVPFGGPAGRGAGGMSPAVPFTIAAVLLAFAGFGGYMWYSKRESTPTTTAGTSTGGMTTSMTTGGLTAGGTTTGGFTTDTTGGTADTTGGFTAGATGTDDTTGGFTADTTGGSSVIRGVPGTYSFTGPGGTMTLILKDDMTFEMTVPGSNGKGSYTSDGVNVVLTVLETDGKPASEEDRSQPLKLTVGADGNLTGEGGMSLIRQFP